MQISKMGIVNFTIYIRIASSECMTALQACLQ